MVAINFNKRFAHDVQAGKKTQTCRPGDRVKVGDQLQFFTGQRTAGCKKLADAFCTEVVPVAFDHDFLSVDGQVTRDEAEMEAFAKADGFTSWRQMLDFFRQQYQTCAFQGFLIKWELAKLSQQQRAA